MGPEAEKNNRALAQDKPNNVVPCDNLHGWFELSYAQYLTVPRSALSAMPLDWKNKLAELLEQLDTTIDWRPQEGEQYRVTLHRPTRDEEDLEAYWGVILDDPLSNYRDRVLVRRLRETRTRVSIS